MWVGKTELWGDSLPERAAGMNRLLQLHKHLDPASPEAGPWIHQHLNNFSLFLASAGHLS